MPRGGDCPSAHLPTDGSGVEKLGEKMGRDGEGATSCQAGQLQVRPTTSGPEVLDFSTQW